MASGMKFKRSMDFDQGNKDLLLNDLFYDKDVIAQLTALAGAQLPPITAFGKVGQADDSATFAAAIASGKSFSVAAGTYLVNALVMNQANQKMWLAPGVTLKVKAGGSQTIVEITANGAGIVGNGATLDGSNIGTTSGSLVWAHGDKDQVLDCTLINTPGIGINLSGGSKAKIRGNDITVSAFAGIFSDVSGASREGHDIRDNTVVATGAAYGIQLHGASGSGFFLKRSKVHNNHVTLPVNGNGLCIEVWGGCPGSILKGNVTIGGAMGLSIDGSHGTVAVANQINGPRDDGIEVAGSMNCTITGNHVDGNALTQTGIICSNTAPADGRNTITGNTVINLLVPFGRGIWLQDNTGQGATVTGNTAIAQAPFVVSGGARVTCTGNTWVMANSGATSMELASCTDSIFANNICHGATANALNVYNGTMNGLIIGPNILTGGTPKQLENGWTPGTNGVGSREIPANVPGGDGIYYAPRPSGGDDWNMLQTLCNIADGQNGGTIYLQTGTYKLIAGPLELRNKVTMIGTSRSSTIIKAVAGFPTGGLPVVYLGFQSAALSFASRLEKLTVDANSIPDEGVWSKNGQEMTGLKQVVVSGFRDVGIVMSDGAANWNLEDVEIYPQAAGASKGLHSNNCAGSNRLIGCTVGVSGHLNIGLHINSGTANVHSVHAENCDDGVLFAASDGTAIGVTGPTASANVTNLVRVDGSSRYVFCAGITKNGATNSVKSDFFGKTLTDSFVQSMVVGDEYVARLNHYGDRLAFFGKTAIGQQAAVSAVGAGLSGSGAGTTAGAYDTAAARDAHIALTNQLRVVVNELAARLSAYGLIP